MMPTTLLLLLLLLCVTGHVLAREPPDVDCLVVHLKYVHCSWNKQGPPEVNYTFSSWFADSSSKDVSYCTAYVSDNSTVTGCNQPYDKLITNRFHTFHTRLAHGNKTFVKQHSLKEKVQLYPPVNLTVQNESDYNLWFYWNQTASDCVESNVRFRTNKKMWEMSAVRIGKQSYCINLPSSNSQYELQVQSKVGETCGPSSLWSNWSEPVFWGSSDSTRPATSISVWTVLLYMLTPVALILLAMMLLYHERLRIIPISVVPKPSLVLYDIEDWLQFSKGLKGNFKTNYNEHACPVREYCHDSQSDSESSGGSTLSVTTDQTDSETSCSNSSSSLLVSSQKEQ